VQHTVVLEDLDPVDAGTAAGVYDRPGRTAGTQKKHPAAGQLIANPKKSITEIAFNCGFSGSATFARAFRETFHMSATEWRSQGHPRSRKIRKRNNKISQTLSKMREDFDVSSDYYIDGETQNQVWRVRMKGENQIQVEVRDMPAFYVAYVRHISPYKGKGEFLRDSMRSS